MALRTPYDFSKDQAEYGEKLVSVADPIASAAGQSTFYFARHFSFREGTYTFIAEADDAATIWIGTDQLNSRVIASPVLGQAAQNVIYLQQGVFRIDVVLKNVPSAPSPCYFTLVILNDNGDLVYTSSKDGWLLDDAAINDSDLAATEDVRFSLPVFSIMPNWESGITERLAWMTDVLASETDAEQRRSVRRNARRTFEASFLRQNAQRNRIDSFLTGVGASQFMLPLWHEQVRMADGVDMEATGVILDELAMREFRKGDLVLVTNGDPDDYDVLQVGDVEATRFSWAFPPPRSWPVGTRIYPMRQARIYSQPPRVSNITDTVGRAQILFDLVEPYVVEASWGANQNGSPFFHFNVDWADGLDVDYERKSFVLDNDGGMPLVTDHGKFTTTALQVKARLFGRAAAHSFRQFLAAARGRAQKFFCPTFANDVMPVGDTIEGRQMVIRDQGFREAMLIPQPVRIQLAFQFYDAPTIYRSIINAHAVHDGLRTVAETLTLDLPLPHISVTDLKRISFVCETRFDQDQFEIHHPSSNQVVVDVALVLRQFTDKRIAQ